MNDNQQLVVVCGLPGVGKSSVAAAVTEHLDGTRLRTDVVRKDLIPEPTYSKAETKMVYCSFFDRATELLRAGDSVILDATFRKHAQRAKAHQLAEENQVQCTLIHVICDNDVVERRIRIRDDISDADVSVYHQLKEEFEPIELPHETVDNSGTREATERQVHNLF